MKSIYLLTLFLLSIVLISGCTRIPTGECTENWQCADWSECTEGTQTRTCTDINNCGTALNKPVTSQECKIAEYTWQKFTPDTTNPNCLDFCDAKAECLVNADDYPYEIIEPDQKFCRKTLTTYGETQGGGYLFDTCSGGTVNEKDFDSFYCCCPATTTCTESWSCSEWSECINRTQTRTCTDINNCGTEINKPAESQDCNCHSNAIPISLNEYRCSGKYLQRKIQYANCTTKWISWNYCTYGCANNTCLTYEQYKQIQGYWNVDKSSGMIPATITVNGLCPTEYCTLKWDDGETKQVSGEFEEPHTYTTLGKYDISLERSDGFMVLPLSARINIIDETGVLRCENTSANQNSVESGGSVVISVRILPDQRNPYGFTYLASTCSGSTLKSGGVSCSGIIGGWETCTFTCENFYENATITPRVTQTIEGETIYADCPYVYIEVY